MQELGLYGIYNLCQQLKLTSSRLDKERLLLENKHYDDFTELLKFLFDNNVTTGLDIKKINKNIHIDCDKYNNVVDINLMYLLNYVSKNNTGTDVAIANSQYCIGKLVEKFSCIADLQEKLTNFLKEIITKSLKLGIDVKTINKVYMYELIPTFDVQLGTSIEDIKLNGDELIHISQKLNGTRCIYYNGKLWTRSGKQYTGCQHIVDDIILLAIDGFNEPACDLVFDGELVLKECGLSDSEAFQKGTGIANSKSESKTELEYVIFDCLSKSEFEAKECFNIYSTRKIVLDDIVKPTIDKLKLENIKVVPMFYSGYDHKKIWEYLDYAEKHDMEGIMINLDTPYEFRRTHNLIKCKKFHDIDLECIAVENADKGKYKNTLAAITCDYKGNKVKVGSGFSDEQRDFYWNNKNEIVGKVITIKYKEATKNKNGGESLQFPVFVCVREDKTIGDL